MWKAVGVWFIAFRRILSICSAVIGEWVPIMLKSIAAVAPSCLQHEERAHVLSGTNVVAPITIHPSYLCILLIVRLGSSSFFSNHNVLSIFRDLQRSSSAALTERANQRTWFFISVPSPCLVPVRDLMLLFTLTVDADILTQFRWFLKSSFNLLIRLCSRPSWLG